MQPETGLECANLSQGSSLDTHGLNEGLRAGTSVTTNAEKMIEIVRHLHKKELHSIDAIFAHVSLNTRSTHSMLDTFQHALRIADRGPLNLVVVVSQRRPRWRTVCTALQQAVAKHNCAGPERVVLINLKLRNIPDDPDNGEDYTQNSDGLANFDFVEERPQLVAFLLAAVRGLVKEPMQIVRRNDYCRQGCGNEGDSRLFSNKCHTTLVPSHPPGPCVTASSKGLGHSGHKMLAEHRQVKSSKVTDGGFDGGLWAMAGISENLKNGAAVVSLAGSLKKAKPALSIYLSSAWYAAEACSAMAGQFGIGRWSCCGAKTQGAAGCAVQWSCCMRWQPTSESSDFDCERLICRGCLGDPQEAPPMEAQELKCADCPAYVGKVPNGMYFPVRSGCYTLEGDETHRVACFDP